MGEIGASNKKIGEFAMQYPMIDKKRTAERIKLFMRYNCLKPTDIQSYLGLTCVQKYED